jgi:hypothetical protein
MMLQSAPPAGEAWSLVGSWDFSTNVTQWISPTLEPPVELLVMARGITVAWSGTRMPRISLGQDYLNLLR